jgi:thiamine-monophosphate kinase
LAQQHQCFLIGGDTTRGPLSISIQVMGFVGQGRALLRSGAKVGDKIYVSGTLGDAAAGLQNILGELALSRDDAEFCQQKLNMPTPRLDESEKIKTFASACIDISDGLLQDLSHILKASNVGAILDLSTLPLSPVLSKLGNKQIRQFALSGGDDYELLFTVPESNEALFLEEMRNKVSCIGHITIECGKIIDESGKELSTTGYNHFNDS